MSCNAVERDFSFFMPLEIAKSAKGEMRIGGVASDQNAIDLQGEKVLISGLDTSYLLERGAFNWNHQKDPGSLLGEIDIVQKDIDKGTLYVEGKLYPNVAQAEAVYKLMKGMKESGSNRKLGLSVEGKVKEREGKEIRKAWLRAVALTYDPINQSSFVDIIKSLSGYTLNKCENDCTKCQFSECTDVVEKSDPRDITQAVDTGQAAIDPRDLAILLGQAKIRVIDPRVNDHTGALPPITEETLHLNACTKCGKTTTNEDSICDFCKNSGIALEELVPEEDQRGLEIEVEKAEAPGGTGSPTNVGVKAGYKKEGSGVLKKESLDEDEKITTYGAEARKKLKTKELGKKITKSELTEWLQDNGYDGRKSELMSEFLFKAIDLEKAESEGKVKGHHRIRRGRPEWVKPHSRLKGKDLKFKQTLEGAVHKWLDAKDSGETKPFAEWLQKKDLKTYFALIGDIAGPRAFAPKVREEEGTKSVFREGSYARGWEKRDRAERDAVRKLERY